jgi:hypothetical protein
MRIIRPIGLLSLVLTGTLVGARGEQIRTNINPALVYYRAFLLAPDPMPEADRNYLASAKGKEQKLPERFGGIVAGYDNQFGLVREAAHTTAPCDWGIELGPGPNILLPHLGRARAVAQAAQLRAVWALQHGRQQDACDDLLAAFVLGRNVASDDFLIGALVQCAIEALNCGTVAQHFGEFSQDTLKQLMDGFDAAPIRHTMADCIPGEKLGFYDWMVNKIEELRKAHPNDDAKVMHGFRQSGIVMATDFVGYTNFWPRLVAVSGGTSEGVLRLLREEEPLFPRIARILALPQPEYETQAKQFLADTQKSQNPFFPLLNSYFTGFVFGGRAQQVRAREFRSQAELAMVHAAVEYRLHGESGFKNVRDPFGDSCFGFRRFVFKGADRGFELKSAYVGAEAPFVMIFVEKKGPAFEVVGPKAGKALVR